MIQPDSINPLDLPSVPLSAHGELPECSAIYFVLDGNQVLYIGKAEKLRKRWSNHHRYKQIVKTAETPAIAWLEVKETTILKDIEKSLITYFQPKLDRKKIPKNLKQPRTTVSLDEPYYEVLNLWAKKEVRNVGNLIQAIVVTFLRGDTPEPPSEVKALIERLKGEGKL